MTMMPYYHVGGAPGAERTEGLLWISTGYTQPLQLFHHIPPLPLSLHLSHPPLHLLMSLLSCLSVLLVLLTALHKHLLRHTKDNKIKKGQQFINKIFYLTWIWISFTFLDRWQLLNRLESPFCSVSSVLWERLNRLNSGRIFVLGKLRNSPDFSTQSQYRHNSIAAQSLTHSSQTVPQCAKDITLYG